MKSSILPPIAIVLSGVLIAGGILLRPTHQETEGKDAVGSVSRGEMAHVRGVPDAPIRIVEFSDFECPFCARFHPTLERLIVEFGDQLSWEYRHLPLPNHRNAESAARAGECIARLVGGNAFWEYADRAFTEQRSLGNTFYETEAVRLGADKAEFVSCMQDPEIAAIVEKDRDDAIANGANATPFMVVLYEDDTRKTFAGALPYEQVKALIENK